MTQGGYDWEPYKQKFSLKGIVMIHSIRAYKDCDLNDVLSSWENASKLAHPFLTEEFLNLERHNIPNVYLPVADTWVYENDQKVIGFIALIGNEVGAIFVQPELHGTGAGRALMDKAQDLHGDLEVEVFEANSIGRNFYLRYGFQFISEKIHEQTGNKVLRLKFSTANEDCK
jgi:putative acetyltransferase